MSEILELQTKHRVCRWCRHAMKNKIIIRKLKQFLSYSIIYNCFTFFPPWQVNLQCLGRLSELRAHYSIVVQMKYFNETVCSSVESSKIIFSITYVSSRFCRYIDQWRFTSSSFYRGGTVAIQNLPILSGFFFFFFF